MLDKSYSILKNKPIQLVALFSTLLGGVLGIIHIIDEITDKKLLNFIDEITISYIFYLTILFLPTYIRTFIAEKGIKNILYALFSDNAITFIMIIQVISISYLSFRLQNNHGIGNFIITFIIPFGFFIFNFFFQYIDLRAFKALFIILILSI